MSWIVVEQSPPKHYEEIVFFDNNGDTPKIKIGYSDPTGFVSEGVIYYQVSHWMPMPEPPEMEKE